MLKEIVELQEAQERLILPHRKKIEKIVNRYAAKVKAIQDKCKHKNHTVRYADNGDGYSYCEYTQWANYFCEDCGFAWEIKTKHMGPS